MSHYFFDTQYHMSTSWTYRDTKHYKTHMKIFVLAIEKHRWKFFNARNIKNMDHMWTLPWVPGCLAGLYFLSPNSPKVGGGGEIFFAKKDG